MDLVRLNRFANRQVDCFTYHQALLCGWSHDTVVDNARRGLWDELAPHVYRARPAGRASWQQRLAALTLSVDGVAFGRSAAALFGLLPPPEEAEVLVVRNGRNRLRPGLHSTRSLPSAEVARVGGIRATIPARTVIDAAGALTQGNVIRLVDRAVVRRLVRPSSIWRRAVELQNSKRPGCRKVLLALTSQHPDLAQARNDWEALVLRLAAEAGLPEPTPNYPVVVGGQRRMLDVAWPEPKVDLEFDGFDPHMVRSVFDDDRIRQNALVAAGWTVFRATSQMLRDDPHTVFRAIHASLEDRGHAISPSSEVA